MLNENNNKMPDEKEKKKPSRRRMPSPFAGNLRAVLEERGLTAKECARLAGVADSVFHGWINGSAPADFGAVSRLAEKLKVGFEWLLTGKSSAVGKGELPLAELFNIERDAAFSGLFLVEAKRLKRKEEK